MFLFIIIHSEWEMWKTQAGSKWQAWNTEGSNLIEFSFETDWNSFAYEICFAIYLVQILRRMCFIRCSWGWRFWEEVRVGQEVPWWAWYLHRLPTPRGAALLLSFSSYLTTAETVCLRGGKCPNSQCFLTCKILQWLPDSSII